MPYALFSHAAQVSQAFPTKSEVWEHAAESGLVIEVKADEEDPPRRTLDMDFEIRECASQPLEHGAGTGMSEHDIAKMIAAAASRPLEAAAS